mmetsp:Transcript_72034/g.185811  ORF Transcript_72034/g.185811 Transcript_72034/m.185811 type:complete len:243 (-) Transcript_72034:47-775(-)
MVGKPTSPTRHWAESCSNTCAAKPPKLHRCLGTLPPMQGFKDTLPRSPSPALGVSKHFAVPLMLRAPVTRSWAHFCIPDVRSQSHRCTVSPPASRHRCSPYLICPVRSSPVHVGAELSPSSQGCMKTSEPFSPSTWRQPPSLLRMTPLEVPDPSSYSAIRCTFCVEGVTHWMPRRAKTAMPKAVTASVVFRTTWDVSGRILSALGALSSCDSASCTSVTELYESRTQRTGLPSATMAALGLS